MNKSDQYTSRDLAVILNSLKQAERDYIVKASKADLEGDTDSRAAADANAKMIAEAIHKTDAQLQARGAYL